MNNVEKHLDITYNHYFEFENHIGDFACVDKNNFCGKDADVSKGQGIYFKSGYTWLWKDGGRRSEVFDTIQECFNSAFENCFAVHEKQDRTEPIDDWMDYARDNWLDDSYIMTIMRKESEGIEYE